MKIKYANYHAGLLGNVNILDEDQVDITNIELDERILNVSKRRKPNQKYVLGDAGDHLIKNYKEFDFIWASPPCQSHSRMMKATRHNVAKLPDMALYQFIIFLDKWFKGLWVVENVVPYYTPLIKPTARIGRHLFWSNFDITQPDFEIKSPKGFSQLATVEAKKIMMDWLGIHYDENIYYGNNHCPVQILRNCVHPKLGKHIFDCAYPAPKPLFPSQKKELTLF